VKKKLNRKQIRNLVLKEVKQLLEDAGSPDTESALENILEVLNGEMKREIIYIILRLLRFDFKGLS